MKRIIFGFVIGVWINSSYPDLGPALYRVFVDVIEESGLKEKIIDNLKEI